MAQTYLAPGVYIEEIDKGTRPIEAVGASLAAFIGMTAEATRKKLDPDTGQRVPVESRLNKATLVTSWTQFVDTFGDLVPGIYLPDAVYGYFANGGGPCYVTSLRALQEGAAALAPSVTIPAKTKGSSFTVQAKTPGPEFQGLSVSVVYTGEETFSLTIGSETRTGLSMKKGENYLGDASFEKALISAVGTAAALPAEGSYQLSGGVISQLTVDEIVGSVEGRTGLGGLEALEAVRLVTCPDLMVGFDNSPAERQRVRDIQGALVDHCQRLRYRFAILDAPPGLNAQEALDWRNYTNFDSSFAALYYPWIEITDLSRGQGSKRVPPSGHVAGVYNRSDAERGVHKAPANDVIAGAVDLEIQLSKGEQELLNPAGVNCIRAFPGRGIRIWGARTLSSNGAWRYINVRRLFILVEASLDIGMQWVVFEPNDRTLWAKVRRDAVSFLKGIWRSGALFGNTPEEAFYVKCDETLNTDDVRDRGMLIIEIGLAPIKPAEFVIFRLTQWAGANAENS